MKKCCKNKQLQYKKFSKIINKNPFFSLISIIENICVRINKICKIIFENKVKFYGYISQKIKCVLSKMTKNTCIHIKKVDKIE